MLFKEDSAARAQHQAVRENVGFYQWTHDLVKVTGADAGKFLDHLFVNSILKAAVGRTKYTTMLNEDGRIIDDTIVMHMGENEYWVSTLYAPQFIRWADGHKDGFAVQYRDITAEIVMYAVQGPRSAEMMDALASAPVDGLKRFQIEENTICGIPVRVHRSGFTGENGYEIYCGKAEAAAVESALRKTGKAFAAAEVNILEVYVRSLPVEKGFALRQDMYGLTPYECGLDWSVDLSKDFVGRDALLRAQAEGPQRLLVGLHYLAESYEDISQREIVYHQGVPCGFVRAAVYGYTAEKNIGFAVIEAAHAVCGEEVTVGSNDSPAVVTDKCFL